MASEPYIQLSFPQQPEQLYTIQHEFAESPYAARCPYSNFVKGVKWSSDGACLLTASDDSILRVFDVPQDAMQASTSDPQPADALPGAAPSPTAGAPNSEQARGNPQSSAADPSLDKEVNMDGAAAGDGMRPAVIVDVGETIYDFSWYPQMSVADPVSCCFASTTRAHPIHVWDAVTGDLRCSYR